MGDGYSVAWRQLDAQYWGVPQRRKRIYLVADFAGERAGEILFERESLRGHPAACGATGRGAAADATGGTGGSRDIDCMNPRAVTVYRSPKFGEYAADGTASTMAARDFKSPRDLIVEHENRVTDYTNVITYGGDKAGTLDASYYKGAGARNGKEREFVAERKAGHNYIIRRLTPLECCRLQGFPDGWGIPDHKDKLSDEELAFWQGVRDTCAGIAGKPPKKYSAGALTKWYNALHTDSAEYKMWGNGIALPCAAFVLAGIAEKLEGK